jgi:hypothetical protein
LSTDGEVTLATYSCNVGYTMLGEQLSYCLNDGSWNGTAPSCGKFYVFICSNKFLFNSLRYLFSKIIQNEPISKIKTSSVQILFIHYDINILFIMFDISYRLKDTL